MAKAILSNFVGGIVNDPRDSSNGVALVVTNFDINTSPNRLIPFRSSEDGNSNAANDTMQNWLIALRTGTTYSIYGYGRVTASNKVRIFIKEFGTGAANDLDDNGWSETANNVSATQVTPSYECFIYYKKTASIYGIHAARYVWKYDPTGSGAFGETERDLGAGIAHVAQGIVHSKDDTLYIPYDNKIASLNNTTWTTAALTLPAQYYITSICEYNNFIAIAAAPLDGVSNSRVFIWDRSTTLTTITENIDWGYGSLKVLEEVGGYLIGISLYGVSSTTFKDRLVFKYYTGASAVAYEEILGVSGSSLTTTKQKINNRVYFAGKISLNGTVREGVWSFGKVGNKFTLVNERTPNNDTALTNGLMLGFFYIGDYLFQAFTLNSGANYVSKTDDQPTYSATSIFESVINLNMTLADKIKLKQLHSISIGYKTLSAISGQVVVKYKVDGGSYTTICTCTTTGLNVLEFKDAAGVPFTMGREYEFRLESTLGADIINFEYDYSVIPTLA